jgi:hypothetical protein
MKKLFVFLIFCSLVFAGLDGNRFFTDEFEINAPDSWKIDQNKKGKAITYFRGDEISEVSVEITPLEPSQRNAEDLARSQIIAYDGWQYVAGRTLDWNEKHGADTAFSCMYHKVMLRGMSTNNKVIIQEGYYVKGRRAYIVTLVTDAARWNDAKGDLLWIWNSFNIK